ncbi:MAG: histidine kinase [Thermodesulfovibrio aggregans]|uniref:Histidine kinase n=2 Tax=Thermodesulfovibrio TaxID=28261 RepID=A0A2J6WQ57_9BACT|nr:MAG: histidine kinase [Thermodesulfovibrio aggregans]
MVKIIEDTIEFLKNVPPFEFLDTEIINSVAVKTSMEYYPKGTYILIQDGSPSEFLYIIKKGGVKVYRRANAEEVTIDFRSEGDSFGFVSLISGDKSRANVVAIDDTICYLIPKDTILNLINKYPEVRDFYLKSFMNIYLDKKYAEETSKRALTGTVDKLLFTTSVEEIASKNVISIPEHTPIREAAGIMCENRISSLIIMNSEGIPVGIITDKDLRRKVVAAARDVNEPVKNIMSFPIIKIDAKDYCFEAIVRMLKYNIHHLLVIKNGQVSGIITNHDIMMLQGLSPVTIVRDIEMQQNIEGIINASKQITNLVGNLLQQGAKASNITRIIAEINDRIVRKIIQFAEREFGPAPIPYCWIALGSEGRKEQTFKTDQDNALIYAEPPAGQEESIRRYFLEFTSYVKENLLKCGFPACPGDIMASNPRWCQPIKVWKKYFSQWVYTPKGESITLSNIFFDFRAIYGDFSLEESLKDYLLNIVKDQRVFLGYLANLAVKNKPPLGFFKTFVVEKSGEHKDKLNIKIKGIAPIVDIVRLFSLEKGIRETSTLERIEALKNKHAVVKDYAEEIIYAFEFLMLLRIKHQYEQVIQGKMPDNFINPETLSNLEKKLLKDTFHLISRLQDILIEKYKLMII